MEILTILDGEKLKAAINPRHVVAITCDGNALKIVTVNELLTFKMPSEADAETFFTRLHDQWRTCTT